MIRIMNDPSDDKITAAYMAGLVSGAGQNTGGITQTQLNAEKGKTAAAEQGRIDAENKLATAERAREAAEKRARDAEQAREAAEKRSRDAEQAREAAEKRARDAEQARQAAERARLAVEKKVETAERNVEFVEKLNKENDALRNKNSVLAAENENLKSRVRGLDSTMKKNEEFIKSQVATINELQENIETVKAEAGPAASRQISEQIDEISKELEVQPRSITRRDNISYTGIRSDICRLVGDYVQQKIFNDKQNIDYDVNGLKRYANDRKNYVLNLVDQVVSKQIPGNFNFLRYRFRF